MPVPSGPARPPDAILGGEPEGSSPQSGLAVSTAGIRAGPAGLPGSPGDETSGQAVVWLEVTVVPWFGWVGFLAGVVVLLAVDLLWFHRRAHEVQTREAVVWSAFYVSVGLGFSAVVALTLGGRAATEYLAGYVIEWSLSVDNIFVFVVLL